LTSVKKSLSAFYDVTYSTACKIILFSKKNKPRVTTGWDVFTPDIVLPAKDRFA